LWQVTQYRFSISWYATGVFALFAADGAAAAGV
jgi:hypothetical protein